MGIGVGSCVGSRDGICGVELGVRAEVGLLDGPRAASGTVGGPTLGIADTLKLLGDRVSCGAPVDSAVGSADCVVPILGSTVTVEMGAMKLGDADLTGRCAL